MNREWDVKPTLLLDVPVRSKLRPATVPPKMLRLLAVDIAALPETVVLVDQLVISTTPCPVRFDDEENREEKEDGAGRYHLANCTLTVPISAHFTAHGTLTDCD